MRILPILFNTDMVRAILEGRKTATRRVIKPEQLSGVGCMQCPNNTPKEFLEVRDSMFEPYRSMPDRELIGTIYKPRYEKDDILYVRETWAWEPCWDCGMDTEEGGCGYEYERVYNQKKKEYGCYCYRASMSDGEELSVNTWHPSIHMPKVAARIWLKVTDVRSECLQDIDGKEVLKEGLNSLVHPKADYFNMNQREMFEDLWNSTIKKSDIERYGWDANPWVWVIEFERCEKPEGWCV